MPIENLLPREQGYDSAIHRTFQRWAQCSVFPCIRAVPAAECAELGGVKWEWQSADCALGKARLGGCHWPEPHRPGHGAPLSVVASGANVHDAKLRVRTLERIVVASPAAAGDPAPKGV